MKTVTQTTNKQSLEWWEKTHTEAATLAKWMAMYEAINIVADKAEEKGIPPEEIVYKPKAIQDYIDKTQDIILRKLLEQDFKIQICYSEEPNDKESYIV